MLPTVPLCCLTSYHVLQNIHHYRWGFIKKKTRIFLILSISEVLAAPQWTTCGPMCGLITQFGSKAFRNTSQGALQPTHSFHVWTAAILDWLRSSDPTSAALLQCLQHFFNRAAQHNSEAQNTLMTPKGLFSRSYLMLLRLFWLFNCVDSIEVGHYHNGQVTVMKFSFSSEFTLRWCI